LRGARMFCHGSDAEIVNRRGADGSDNVRKNGTQAVTRHHAYWRDQLSKPKQQPNGEEQLSSNDVLYAGQLKSEAARYACNTMFD